MERNTCWPHPELTPRVRHRSEGRAKEHWSQAHQLHQGLKTTRVPPQPRPVPRCGVCTPNMGQASCLYPGHGRLAVKHPDGTSGGTQGESHTGSSRISHHRLANTKTSATEYVPSTQNLSTQFLYTTWFTIILYSLWSYNSSQTSNTAMCSKPTGQQLLSCTYDSTQLSTIAALPQNQSFS